MVLRGDPGIGKTVLWRSFLETGRQECRILSSRPVQAEARLSFAALDDLLDEVLDETLPALPGPKRHALEVAVLRADPGRRPPDRRTVSRAVLDVLRLLARKSPLILAIDDVQWLDLPSARVIEFVVRRFEDDPIGILLVRRIDGADHSAPVALERALPEGRLRVIDVGPLGLASIQEMLRFRLGANFPRHVLVRISEQSGGNPFFALEIARALLKEEVLPAPGDVLSVPDSLSELVRWRLSSLPPAAQDLLFSVAALSQPTVGLVTEFGGSASADLLQETVEAGVIQLEGEQVRFTHPLLASVSYAGISMNKKRQFHRRLADIARDQEERVRHLALAATGPDDATASALDQAAHAAGGRGAPDAAAILSEEAFRLTPSDHQEDRDRRELEGADYHFQAGDTSRARGLLEDVLSRTSAGPRRAWVLYRLAFVRAWQEESWQEAEELLRAALAEAGDDPSLRASLHLSLAGARLVAGDLGDAVAQAHVAGSMVEPVEDPRFQAAVLETVAWYEFLQGLETYAPLLERAHTLERTHALEIDADPEPMWPWLLQPGMAQGLILKWTDDFEGARANLEQHHRRAVDTGDERNMPFILYHLSELECWSGNWDAAARYAEEGHKIALYSGQQGVRAAVLYTRALEEALRGLVDLARADAEEALSLCQRSGNVPVMTLTLSVLGFIGLSVGDFRGAHAYLGPMAETIAAVGLREPGVVKFVPDEVESLISLGEIELARTLIDQLEERGKALGRTWALATGARCRALLEAATGDLEGAQTSLERAIEEHQRLPMPFELGRTLLVAGTIHRRAKRKRVAKESLQQALEVFERLGAPLWADKARHELGRVGLRPAAPHGLTPTEQRVAELVAEGYTNKEVAEALFVSPKTVDSNLSRIYRKLGVRSRTELASKLSQTGRSSSF